MKSEDTEARINAMRKLKVIAQALGPERTRKELVPYLNGEPHELQCALVGGPPDVLAVCRGGPRRPAFSQQ